MKLLFFDMITATNNKQYIHYIQYRTCHTNYTLMLSTADNGVVDLRDRYAMQKNN